MRVAITSRSVALDLLNKVSIDGTYANLAMPQLLEHARLEPRDSAFAQELAFSTVRWMQTYDAIIDKVSSRPVTDIETTLLNAIRLGTHQLLQMRVPAHAAINETVNLIRQVCGEKVVGFANGVLRRVSEKDFDTWLDLISQSEKTNTAVLALRNSHPEWIVRALQQSLKSDGIEDSIEELLEANNRPAHVTLVALPGLSKREDYVADGGFATNFSPYGFSIESGNPGELEELRRGAVRVQDEGSQLAALALVEARPVAAGEQWLDVCAGPGGKAALLAALAEQNGAHLVANELQEHRAKLVSNALAPFPDVEMTVLDGRSFGDSHPNHFDRILLDAPCTGLGALRRRPEARWRKSSEDLKQLVELQYELLESSYKALKPGGQLLYVTCSPHLSETTAVITKAVKNLSVQVQNLTAVMNENFMGGTLPTNRKTVQLYTHRDGTDCMFMALITK